MKGSKCPHSILLQPATKSSYQFIRNTGSQLCHSSKLHSKYTYCWIQNEKNYFNIIEVLKIRQDNFCLGFIMELCFNATMKTKALNQTRPAQMGAKLQAHDCVFFLYDSVFIGWNHCSPAKPFVLLWSYNIFVSNN